MIVEVVVIVFLGFAAMIGGALTLGGQGYKASLGAAVCALPSTIFGILALIFIVLGRREFRANRPQGIEGGLVPSKRHSWSYDRAV